MKVHQLDIAEAFASVRSRPEGLGREEAARRVVEFGPNRIEPVHGESMALRLVKSLTHFFALILWIAAALAFAADHREPGQGMAMLGWAILGVIGINGGFSFWQEYRAEQALEALQRLLPARVCVVREGRPERIDATGLVPGDVLLLGAGDRVPADCRVIRAVGLRVNNATVTGESLPHAREACSSEEIDPAMARNVLLAGTSVVSGEGAGLVFATGPHTAFGRIAHLSQSQRAPLSPLQKEAARLSRWVAALSLGLGAVFFLLGRSLGLPFWSNFVFAIGVIVANVPEGLLPTLTLALAMASQRMARRRVLVRHLPAVETLGTATVVCTDKTGTLTENRLEVRQLQAGGRPVECSNPAEVAAAARTHPRIFDVAAHCHTAKSQRNTTGHREWLGDPLERALIEFASRALPQGWEPWEKLSEIPFDSVRRRMTTMHRSEHGTLVLMKGAPESVLPACVGVEGPSGVEPLTVERGQQLLKDQELMAARGFRVLAMAWREDGAGRGKRRAADLECGLILAGFVGLVDPPRPEVADAVRRCREAGVRVIMITGDHPRTAMWVARSTGLVLSPSPRVITGDDLGRISDVQLQLELETPEILFARVTAGQKMRIVCALKRKREIVAVTGDGVNDAPALRQADIGISMGIAGTDVARESSDVVLLDDNFAAIVAGIEEGRAVYENIRKFLTYILTSNVPELVPYLACVLLGMPLALTVIQILAVDLGTDMVPALALGAEAPSPGVLRRPPRGEGERLIDVALLVRAYLWLGLMQAAGCLWMFRATLEAGGWRPGDTLAPADPLYRVATTACLATVVVMQVSNLLCCREPARSVLRTGLRGNWLLPFGVGVELVLLAGIVYTPWGNALFGTAGLPLGAWIRMLPLAVGMLLAEELRKLVVKGARHSGDTP